MKTTTKILSLLLTLLVSGVVFTSCGKDDDEPNPDVAGLVQGTYIGTGTLQVSGISMDVESYPGMKVNLERSSNEYIILTPYNADNTPFFSDGKGTVYQVSRLTNGDFLLTSTEVPLAQLRVSASYEMTYYYPYVKVGGESGYALKFTGKRQ